MAINAATLRALASAGATADMIIAAVEAEQSTVEAKAAERRQKNRDRMRLVRASKSVQAVQCTVAHNDAQARTEISEAQMLDTEAPPDTTACAAPEPCAQHNAHTDEKRALSFLLPSFEKDTTEEVREGKKDIKSAPKKRGGHKLPDDWRPTEKHYAEGLKLGHTRQGVDDQAEDMRLWARSNEHRAVARKTSWDMTFSGWLRRNKPKIKENGNGKLNVHDAAARLTANLRALDEPAPSDLCERASGGPIRRLSSG